MAQIQVNSDGIHTNVDSVAYLASEIRFIFRHSDKIVIHRQEPTNVLIYIKKN